MARIPGLENVRGISVYFQSRFVVYLKPPKTGFVPAPDFPNVDSSSLPLLLLLLLLLLLHVWQRLKVCSLEARSDCLF